MLVSNWPFVAGCRLCLHWNYSEKYSSEKGLALCARRLLHPHVFGESS